MKKESEQIIKEKASEWPKKRRTTENKNDRIIEIRKYTIRSV